jgi:hypothetical protein
MRPRPETAGGTALAITALTMASLAASSCDAPVDVVATALSSDDAATPDAGDAGDAGDPVQPLRCEDGRSWAAAARAAAARHGLCTCGDLSSASTLEIRGGVAGAASLGVGGGGTQVADARVDGDVTVAGAEGLRPGTRLEVGGALQVGGPLLGAQAAVTVGGDAEVADRVQVRSLAVGGRLRVPAGTPVEVAEGSAPETSAVDAVEIADPCACGPDDEADFDAAAGAVTGTVDDPETADCDGTLLQADGLTGLTLRPRGPTRYLVPGDVAVDGALRIEPPAGVVVELWVAGNMRVDGEVVLGGDAGGRVEVFIAGAGTIELTRGGALNGSLHAPAAELVLPAPLSVDGALLVRRLAAEAPVTIRVR